jgi:hypothetical protein
LHLSYNATGAERKRLVGAISQILNAPAKYLGMPSAAYEVGAYCIDKTGTVTGPDNRDLMNALAEPHGFVSLIGDFDDGEEYTEVLPENNEPAGDALVFEDLRMTEREELGLGQERHDSIGKDGMQASDVPEPDSFCIEVPLDGFTPEKLDNLTILVSAKAALLKTALCADDLPIQHTGETLRFPWFSGELDAEHTQAYATLISLLCKTALSKKRITAKEKEIDGSPKFAMRCFLISLGMIGEDYKAARKILLKNLPGSSSFKTKDREDAWKEKHGGKVATAAGTNDLAEETEVADNVTVSE